MQSFFKQHPNTVFDVDTQSSNSQEHRHYLNNHNASVNGLSLSKNDSNGRHTYPAIQEQNDSSLVESLNGSNQIQVKFQPRPTYHPRTLKECESETYYIRSDKSRKTPYPTISLFPAWSIQSKDNFIEVALVDINNQPHPYTIATKEPNSVEGRSLIFRDDDNAPNILNFRLTDDDFTNGSKTFKIELIKSKQDNIITKQLIQERQLEKSKLRFTRIFCDKNDCYRRDEASTAYSCVMTEKSGDVAVKYINPPFGPMSGTYLLDVVFTGLTAKDKKKLSFEISEEKTCWKHQIKSFYSHGSTIHFSMPPFPFSQNNNDILTSIIVYYEGQNIYKASYLYVKSLDKILNRFNLNKSSQADAEHMISDSCNDSNQDHIDSSCSSSTASKKPSKTKSRKRQRTN